MLRIPNRTLMKKKEERKEKRKKEEQNSNKTNKFTNSLTLPNAKTNTNSPAFDRLQNSSYLFFLFIHLVIEISLQHLNHNHHADPFPAHNSTVFRHVKFI